MDPVMAWLLKLGVDPNVAQQLMAPRTAAAQQQSAAPPQSAPQSAPSQARASFVPRPPGMSADEQRALAVQAWNSQDTEEQQHQRMSSFFQSRYRMPADQADKLAVYTLSNASLNPITQKHMDEASKMEAKREQRRYSENTQAQLQHPNPHGAAAPNYKMMVMNPLAELPEPKPPSDEWWDYPRNTVAAGGGNGREPIDAGGGLTGWRMAMSKLWQQTHPNNQYQTPPVGTTSMIPASIGGLIGGY